MSAAEVAQATARLRQFPAAGGSLDEWADDIATVLGALVSAQADRKVLAQAMHDARGILGFDLDGDPTPAAQLGGQGAYERYATWFLRDIREARADHDEVQREVTDAERALTTAADREARVRALCDEGDRMHGTVRTAQLRAALDPQDPT